MEQHTTKDGKQFSIRRPATGDAAAVLTYSTQLFASTDQVLTSPEEFRMTIEQEAQWIDGFSSNPNSLLLVAEIEQQIAGLVFFVPNQKIKNAHTGEFGLSVHPLFQGTGIGRALIKTLLNWARQNEKIEKVYLQVFDSNKKAISLYESLGFIAEGRHIGAIKQAGGIYVDILQMYIHTGQSQ